MRQETIRKALERGFQSDLLMAAVAGVLSVCLSGYAFGVSNNLFHLSIVAGLYDLPQFQDDMFTQSLRYFSSGLWMLLAGSDAYIPAYWSFLILLVASRALTFWGLLYCCAYLGYRSLRDRSILTLTFLTAQLMHVYSFAGAGGIFVDYFTHSEVANGLTLIALGLVLRQRVAAGLAVNGAVFFVNAFVGVWNVAPIGLLLLYKLAQREMTFGDVMKRGLLGSAALLAIASPVIWNLFTNPSFGQALDFSYREFLAGYFADHFLFAELGVARPLLLLGVTALMVVTFTEYGKAGRPFLVIGAGYVIVYAVGIVLPLLTDSHTLLNLHLLRVGTFLHILAVMGCGVLAVEWLKDKSQPHGGIWAAGLIVIGSVPKAFILVLPYVLLRQARLPNWLIGALPRALVWGALGAVAAGAIGFALVRNYGAIDTLNRNTEAYRVMGEWARTQTEPDAIFLIPMGEDRELDDTKFQYASHRQVWVNFKQGAATMWYPPFHAVWEARTGEVTKLDSFDAKLDYARANGIGYILAFCEPGRPGTFQYEDFCAYHVSDLE